MYLPAVEIQHPAPVDAGLSAAEVRDRAGPLDGNNIAIRDHSKGQGPPVHVRPGEVIDRLDAPFRAEIGGAARKDDGGIGRQQGNNRICIVTRDGASQCRNRRGVLVCHSVVISLFVGYRDEARTNHVPVLRVTGPQFLGDGAVGVGIGWFNL
jgi:hypothetical protein